MPWTLADKAVARRDDGTTSPARHLLVKAQPSLVPLFFTPDSGATWLEMQGSEIYTVTADDGSWALTLPTPSESNPSTLNWTITLPDGSLWTGPPQSSGSWSIYQLKNLGSGAWTLISGPAPGPTNGIAGSPGLTWRNAWASGIAYNIGDAVNSGGASYICISNHTSSAANAPPSAFWNLLAAGGSGTTVNATLSVPGSVIVDLLPPSGPPQATSTTASQHYNALRTGPDPTGLSDSTAALALALSNAANGTKRLYIPAGTYLISGSNTLFSLAAANMEVFGDGASQTILKIAPNLVLNNPLTVFLLSNLKQSIHHLSIQGSGGYSGSQNMIGVQINNAALSSHVHHCEFSGLYGGSTAGAAAITTYQPWNQAEVTTTLGTAVPGAGSTTCTPTSMAGIYIDRVLTIAGANPESVTVSATTASTFTATFTAAHLAADPLIASSQGNQYALLERNHIHDIYAGCGIIANSSSNTISHNTLVAIGSNQNQHGIYLQGGNNLVSGNTLEGCSGASIHGHKAVANIDASGDRCIANLSTNPGRWHILADTLTSDGTNPEVPSGQPLNRYLQIAGNTFRGRKAATNPYGIELDAVPAIISGNVFEDAATQRFLFAQTATNLIVDSNLFSCLNQPALTQAVLTGDRATIRGNQFTNLKGPAIQAGKNSSLSGNRLEIVSSSPAITVDSGSVVVDNTIAQTGTGLVIDFVTSCSGALVSDNTISSANASWAQVTNTRGVVFRGNIVSGGAYLRFDTGSQTLKFIDNDSPISLSGYTAASLGPASGNLVYLPKDNTAMNSGGLLMKMVAGSVVTPIGTSDTSFLGIAVSGAGGANSDFYLAASVGSEVWNVQTDGAWTAGHIGIPSTTVAAKLHDTGAVTIPGAGSYVLFLDSGGGAGAAKILLLKTL